MAESGFIKGYRHKETLPHSFDKATILRFAEAAQLGTQLGVPPVAKEQLVNKILLEGRSDAGTNEYNYNNKKAKQVYDALVAFGVDEQAARYPAAVLDKMDVANRRGVSFEEAWNGLGRTSEGRTGKQHADRAAIHKDADKDPRNKELMDLVSRAFIGDLSPTENLMKLNAKTLRNTLFGVEGMEESGIPWEQVGRKLKENATNMFTEAEKKLTKDKAAKKALDVYRAETRGAITNPNSLIYNLPDAYRQAAGIIYPNEKSFLLGDPILAVLTGADPDGEKFIAKAKEEAKAFEASKNNADSATVEISVGDRVLNLIRSFAK